MCGIFGFANDQQHPMSGQQVQKATEALFRVSESRGKEASGVAVYQAQTLDVFKQPLSARKFIKQPLFKSLFQGLSAYHNVFVMGHSRLVTNGSQLNDDNNQPVIKDRAVAIHNGIIVNHKKLWQQADGPSVSPSRNKEELHLSERRYDIDSEVILSLMRAHLMRGCNIQQATAKTFLTIEGSASVAMFFEERMSVLLATNTGSLYYIYNPQQKSFVFASEYTMLKRFMDSKVWQKLFSGFAIEQIQPGQGLTFDLQSCAINIFRFASPEMEPDPIRQDGIHINRLIDATRNLDSSYSPIVYTSSLPESFWNRFESRVQASQNLKRCSQCVLPETMPFITFDHEGVCHFCRNHQSIQLKGALALQNLMAEHMRQYQSDECIVALSGGRDSCYVLDYVKRELKMKPIAFTYDWGMVTDLARRNQARLCGRLGIEHIIVSADLAFKRNNIRKNVSAWLKRPELGMIPLFMAGDKQYFHYAYQLKRNLNVPLLILGENLFEKTAFKTGFCGVAENKSQLSYGMKLKNKSRLAAYYAKQYLKNPAYMNASLYDSLWAFRCYYSNSFHTYINLFDYLPWDESDVVDLLRDEYDWELAKDTKSTWRIGDGTAAFYNYIYFMLAGFTEHDTFRSNQIRENVITRQQALDFVAVENRPRVETIFEYFQLIGLDPATVLARIQDIKPLKAMQKAHPIKNKATVFSS